MKISRQLPDGSEDWVYNTAIYSASCQIVLGLISLFGFIKTPTPKTQILRPLLVIDLLVQLIEFSFYALFICYKKLDTWYRYIDWFFSTPLMLISTMAFLEYVSTQDLSVSTFFGAYSNDVIYVTILNAGMLMSGLCVELKLVPFFLGLIVGWIFFLSVFISIYVRIAYQSPGAICVQTFTFVVWSMYGVAAFFNPVQKNVAYNLLDVVSKNFYGVLVTIYLLSENT